MKKINKNNKERIIAFFVGIIFIFIAYNYLSGIWQIGLYLFACLPLFRAITGICLMKKIFGN